MWTAAWGSLGKLKLVSAATREWCVRGGRSTTLHRFSQNLQCSADCLCIAAGQDVFKGTAQGDLKGMVLIFHRRQTGNRVRHASPLSGLTVQHKQIDIQRQCRDIFPYLPHPPGIRSIDEFR